ncbi:MAG: DUF4421 family protein, partial [Bdellovibrionota bacterium]
YGLTLAYKTPVTGGPQREPSEGGLSSEAKYGKTESSDIRLMLALGSKDQWFISSYFNNFKGFYIENTSEVDPSRTSSDPRLQRPDLGIENLGATVTYVFSAESLSIPAAISQAARQTSSGGSFTLGVGFEQTRIKAESTIVPSQLSGQYGANAQLTDGTFTTASIIPGFGYTVAGDGPFVTLLAGVGLGSQMKSYSVAGSSFSESGFAWKLIWSVSAGYHGDTLLAGATVYNDQTSFNTGALGVTSQLYAMRIYTGIHF